MKKIILSCLIIVVILIGGGLVLQKVNFNRLGADQLYTQIKGQGKMIEDKIDNGEKIIRYEYKLPSFDKNGQQQTLSFTSPKQLKENAYLMLYTKKDKGVTSYQEVAKKDLQKKVCEKLK